MIKLSVLLYSEHGGKCGPSQTEHLSSLKIASKNCIRGSVTDQKIGSYNGNVSRHSCKCGKTACCVLQALGAAVGAWGVYMCV